MVLTASRQFSARACLSAGGLATISWARQSVVARTAGSNSFHLRASLDPPRAKAGKDTLRRATARTADRNRMTHTRAGLDTTAKKGNTSGSELPNPLRGAVSSRAHDLGQIVIVLTIIG